MTEGELPAPTGVARSRCERLIGGTISGFDWGFADRAGMDGHGASDEELRGYWAVYRKAREIDEYVDEPPSCAS